MERYQLPPQEKSALERLRQPFAIYQFVDKRVVTLLLSDGFCDLFGYEDHAQAYYDMDNNMYKDTHPDDVARIANAAVRFATEGGRYEVIYRTKIKGGSDYRVVHAFGEHVYTDTGVRLAQVWYTDEGFYEEESGEQRSELNRRLSDALHENSIVKASQYDYLTGLPSMSYFFELAETGKARIWEKGGTPVLMYMDFSGMKFYNARHGFVEGDKLLQSFAKILANLFGNERCCRISADHFAVLAEEKGLDGKLQEMLHACQEMNGGKTLPLHVGVYVEQAVCVHTSIACDRAKLACRALSGRYETAVRYYSQELSEDAVKKQYFVENFDRALAEKWIQVYLQPIVRSVNERVCDVEALARWIDPEKGVLSPADFIPALEDAGLIYKLDLYMIDRVVECILAQKAAGFTIVPHSVNLSRSDFVSCDIVEEVRKRMDAAGIDHALITIEITESTIGSDLEFMKEQVERFRALGFPVWMDDFGSGYSSMDVLQSIRFDLIKFDMSFMRKLNEGEAGKIILTELMKMATSLGLDTVCEGVETEEQVHFLQEIGCSKLQGFYYSKPIPFEAILEMHKRKTLIANENPEESDYYESISRVNLYGLGVIAGEEESRFHNVFNTLPIAILETKDGKVRYIRSNRSYQEFIKRFYNYDILEKPVFFGEADMIYGENFFSVVKQCCRQGNSAFFDERMPDGSVVHSFARRVSSNPVTGIVAVAIAILSITEPDESASYADIARALAADYYNIFVIDLDTNDYIEYSSQVGGEEMSLERHGEDFFTSARHDAMTRIYEEDREPFLTLFTKEKVLRDIDAQGVFTTTYRLIDTDTPVYVNMKITRMHGGNRLILGVSNVDAQMKQQEEEKKLRQEKVSLGRIAALSPNYIVLYIIDPETNRYVQYNPSNEFASLDLANQGEDFFADVELDAPKAIAPEDMERHLRTLKKENMLREIEKNGSFVYNYRFLLGGKYVPATLRAAMVEENDGKKIILGVTNDEEEYNRRLEEAYRKASDTAAIYTHIAHALARGCTDLYYVNMDTDEFIEYHTDDESGVLSEARRGMDFFEACRRDASLYIHPEDQAAYVQTMDRRFLSEVLSREQVYELTYRRIDKGNPFYAQLKFSRMEDDPRFVVISLSDIDELMRQRLAEERIREERVIYARLHALTGNFIVVYVVDPETDRYREFSATDDYAESLAQAKEGTDFFNKVREVARTYNHPDDLSRFLTAFTKENVIAEVEHSGIFTLGYRLMMDGSPIHVQMKAAMVEEKEGVRLIVGLNDIDVQVRQEEEYGKRLAQAQTQANLDALTGVKNSHAYQVAESHINHEIAAHRQAPFAIAVLDVNDLKKVNDTAGHQAGDQYLRDACKTICDIFAHSPVFRVGGDEFAVISQGRDYACMEELLEKLRDHNAEAARSGGVVIACGMSKYRNDDSAAAVFERADRDMYENKKLLKSGNGNR